MKMSDMIRHYFELAGGVPKSIYSNAAFTATSYTALITPSSGGRIVIFDIVIAVSAVGAAPKLRFSSPNKLLIPGAISVTTANPYTVAYTLPPVGDVDATVDLLVASDACAISIGYLEI